MPERVPETRWIYPTRGRVYLYMYYEHFGGHSNRIVTGNCLDTFFVFYSTDVCTCPTTRDDNGEKNIILIYSVGAYAYGARAHAVTSPHRRHVSVARRRRLFLNETYARIVSRVPDVNDRANNRDRVLFRVHGANRR